MKNKHILVVSQYFYPEQFRINDICEEWVKRGYKVSVLTGIPNYPKGKFYEGYKVKLIQKEKYNGIDIIRIPIIPRGKSKLLLALNYISFVISGFVWAFFTKIEVDCVFTYEVSPISQALPAIWYSKRKKLKSIIYITDLWPESFIFATGIKSKVLLKPIEYMVDYIYQNSDRILTSSNSYIDAIIRRGVSKDKLIYWPQYAEDFYKPIEKSSIENVEIPKDDRFNILFAGNIGFAQGLDILPNAAKILNGKGIMVRFNILGDGRYKEHLQKEVIKHNLCNYFNFIEKKPPEMVSEYISLCDVNFISLAKCDVFALTLPSKTQSCLACGKPILVSSDGEIQTIIEDAKAGFCSDAGDVDGFVINVEKIMSLSNDERKELSNNAIKYSRKHFNKITLLDKIETILFEF